MSSDGGSSGGGSSSVFTKGSAYERTVGFFSTGKEDDVFESQSSFLTGIFGVLFSVSKERVTPLIFFVFKYLFDWLQLFTLICNNQFGWTMDPDNKVWTFVGYFQIQPLMVVIGYTGFTVLAYIFSAALVSNVSVCIWVFKSFQNQRFDIWTIKFLRNFGYIFYQVLDIMSLTLFLTALDCQYYDAQAPSEQYHNNEFPDVYCFSAKHLPLFVIASISTVVFVVLAGFFIMGEIEMNPLGLNWDAMTHTQGEILIFVVKVTMTMAQVFIGNYRHLAVIWLICAFLLMYLVLKWVPMLYDWTNHLRSGIYTSIFYISCLFMALQFPPGDVNDDPNPDAYYDYKKKIEAALWGTLPAFVVGMAMSMARLWYFHIYIINKFRAASPGTKTTLIYKFSDAREVEILSRCCRIWRSDESLDYAASSLAERVMRAGLSQMQSNASMAILYSNFLFHVQGFYQSGINQLQAAKKLRPHFLDRFAIFSREQEHAQKFSEGGRPGRALDLVAFVEFQKHYRMALKVHQDALLAVRHFWELLLRSHPSYESLIKSVIRIDTTVQRAEAVYREVLQRHSNTAKILRMYAKFLERVKHDPWSAAKWMAEAEKLDQQEETAKNSMFDMNQDAEGLSPQAMGLVRTAMLTVGPDGREVAVVVINAQSTILMSNQATCDMFGYAKSELHGKSVSLLVPPPASDFHHSYVRNYVETEATGGSVVGKVLPFLALHKDRYIFPIQLTVTKVSGMREDSRFMGTIQATPTATDTAMVWVLPTGQVLSVDATFTDWFGYRASDLQGSSTGALVNSTRLDAIFKLARTAMLAPPVEQPKSEAGSDVNSATGKETDSLWNNLLRGRTNQSATSGAVAEPPSTSSAEHQEIRSSAPQQAFTLTSGAGAVSVFERQRGASGSGTDQSAPIEPFAATARVPQEASTSRLQPALTFTHALSIVRERAPLGHEEWELFAVRFNHKFSDQVMMDVKLRNAGTGALRFHILELRCRPADPNSMSGDKHMLVTDPKGRVLHATESLATIVGSSSKELQSNNTPNAVEMLLPEPFSHMHKQLAGSLPNSTAPLYSCRSGLSVLLLGGQGSVHSRQPRLNLGERLPMFPFTLSFKRRTWVDEVYHVMTLKKLSMDQALDERRLRLVLDESGLVHEVGPSPSSLFGFDPQSLVGHNISLIVDVLKQPGYTSTDVSEMLVELASHSLDLPGVSWRVGVCVPIMEQPSAAPSPSGLSLIVATSMMAKKLKPAVMLVNLLGIEDADPCSVDSIKICIELWRLDMLTSVVETDEKSKVMLAGGEIQKLYPPGLSFGVPETSMDARLVSDFIQLEGRTLRDLLEPAPDPNQSKYKGGLKASIRAHNLVPKRVGPTYQLRVNQHLGDDRDALLSVQVVRKHQGGFYLVCRPSSQLCGRPMFKSYLMNECKQNLEALREQINGTGALNTASSSYHFGMKTRRMSSSINKSSAGFPLGPRSKGASSGRHMTSTPSYQRLAGRTVSQAIPPLVPPGPFVSPPSNPLATLPIPRLSPFPYDDAFHLPPPPLMMEGGSRSSAVVETHPSLQEKGSAEIQSMGDSVSNSQMQRSVSFGSVHPSTSASISGKVGGGHTSMQASTSAARVDIEQDPGGSSWDPERTDSQWGRADCLGPLINLSRGPASIRKEQDSFTVAKGGLDCVPTDHMSEDRADSLAMPLEDSDMYDGKDGSRGYEGSIHSPVPDEVLVDDHVDVGEFRKGARFKKLMKLFSHKIHMAKIRRFRLLTICCVCAIVVVQTGLFVLMNELLTQQQRQVDTLQNMGLSSRAAINIAVHVRLLAMLLAPWPNTYVNRELPLLTDNPSNISALIYQIQSLSEQFKSLHVGAYLGYGNERELPDDYGLRALWQDPGLLQTIIYTDYEGEANYTIPAKNLTFHYVTTNASLFELGMSIASSGSNIALNALAYNKTSVNPTFPNGHWENWTEVQFIIMNTPVTLVNAYMKTMDAMVQVVIDAADHVNVVQLIILVVEGLLLSCVAIIFTWVVSSNYINHRFRIYSVFLAVPNSTIVSLAHQSLHLGEDSDEESTDSEDNLPFSRGQDQHDKTEEKEKESAAVNVVAGPYKREDYSPEHTLKLRDSRGREKTLNTADSVGIEGMPIIDKEETRPKKSRRQPSTWVGFKYAMRTAGNALPWVRRRALADADAKGNRRRRLHISKRTFFFLTSPFLVWGIVIVSINAAGYSKLTTISAPIALFNVINFVLLRFAHTIFYTNELIFEYSEFHRGQLSSRLTEWELEYTVMLNGGEAAETHVGQSKEDMAHFNLVGNGVTFSGSSSGNELLFYTKTCLDTEAYTCLPPGHPFYSLTHNGVDFLVKHTFNELRTIAMANSSSLSTTQSPEFSFVWTTRNSSIGGFDSINKEYENQVLTVYESVLNLHIVAFALTIACMVAYLFFFLRPFLRESIRERRRVAELLCQLPAEVDVEGMVKRAIMPSEQVSPRASRAEKLRSRSQHYGQGSTTDKATPKQGSALEKGAAVSSGRGLAITSMTHAVIIKSGRVESSDRLSGGAAVRGSNHTPGPSFSNPLWHGVKDE